MSPETNKSKGLTWLQRVNLIYPRRLNFLIKVTARRGGDVAAVASEWPSAAPRVAHFSGPWVLGPNADLCATERWTFVISSLLFLSSLTFFLALVLVIILVFVLFYLYLFFSSSPNPSISHLFFIFFFLLFICFLFLFVLVLLVLLLLLPGSYLFPYSLIGLFVCFFIIILLLLLFLLV